MRGSAGNSQVLGTVSALLLFTHSHSAETNQLQHSETSGFFKSSTLQETETGHLLKTFFYSFLLCFFLKGEIFVALHYCINQCYLSVLICIGVLEGIIITLSCIWHNIDHFANLFFKITNIFLNFCLMGIPTLFNLR